MSGGLFGKNQTPKGGTPGSTCIPTRQRASMTVVGVNTSGERDSSLRETEKRHECGTKPAHRSTAAHDHRAAPVAVSGTVRAGESFQSQGLPIPAGRVAHAGVDRRRFVGAGASIRARDRRRCRVAVGTAVTRCPPHRPVLALLVHTVPTLDVWRRSARWDKDVRYGFQEAGQPVAPESAPRSNGSVDSAAEAGAAITAAHLSETPSVDARCPVRRDIGNTPSPQTATTSGCPRWTRACAAAASP